MSSTAIDVYKLHVIVAPYGGLAGTELEDSGLERIKGVHSVERAGEEVSASIATSVGLKVGEQCVIYCFEFGVIFIRSHPGLRLKNQDDLSLLGSGRQLRSLYEVTVRVKRGDDAADVASSAMEARLRSQEMVRK